MNGFITENTGLDEKIVCGNADNGIKYFIIPKTGFNFNGAVFTVGYGSKDIIFSDKDGQTVSPMGTAHFIEHKLFENREGNAFDEFIKNNAEANAFTDFNRTAYYFYTAGDFYKNLDILVDFVAEPYFEKDSVEREKSIIKQEIAMYGDDPFWQTYFDCIGKIYPKASLGEIAGSKKPVEDIDRDMLYKCYGHFYRAANMALICCGSIDPDRVEKALNRVRFNTGEYTGGEGYDFTVAGGENTVRDMGLEIPVFSYGIPLKYDDRCGGIWMKSRIKVLMDIIAGNASRVYNNLYSSGVVKEPPGFEYVCGSGYGFMVFSGASEQYEKAAETIKSCILRFLSDGVPESDFEMCRRKARGRFIRGFNSIDAVCMAQTDIGLGQGTVLQLYDEICTMTRLELEEILRKYVDLNAAVLSAAE